VTDEELAITRLQRGDVDGLQFLVARYYLQALRAAYLVTHDRMAAEDVVQDAFIRVYERIHQFDTTRPFGPWFLRSVINAAVKVSMRADRDLSLDKPAPSTNASFYETLVDGQLSLDEQVIQAETTTAIWTALQQLRPAQRAVIVQRYYLGLSEAELAQVQHCPPGTIKSRLHAARIRLGELLNALRPNVIQTDD
jgi:RNA polymerase sigma-70 factor, ECF subfamily